MTDLRQTMATIPMGIGLVVNGFLVVLFMRVIYPMLSNTSGTGIMDIWYSTSGPSLAYWSAWLVFYIVLFFGSYFFIWLKYFQPLLNRTMPTGGQTHA